MARPSWLASVVISAVAALLVDSTLLTAGCPIVFAPLPSPTFAVPFFMASGDFNEDGIVDLVITRNGSPGLQVLPGLGTAGVGNGQFGVGTTYTTASARQVIAGDFNDDGITDLAVTVPTGVAVRLGTGTGGGGDGGFGAQTVFLAGTSPDPIASGDFNEDGITDLVVGNNLGPSYPVSVLLGNGTGGVGDGTFGAPTSFTTSALPKSIVTGDFNEDGITDLATLGGGNTVKVLLGAGSGGKGNGTFGLAVTTIVGSTGVRIVTGDVNEDGITDLLFPELAGLLSVMLGQGAAGVGNGTFAAPVKYPLGLAATDLGIADFTSDGIADVAVTMGAPDSVAILGGGGAVGVGNGSFALFGRFATHSTPRPVLVGDFLADGTPDLAVASFDSAAVQVFPTGCPVADVSLAVVAPNGGESWPVGGERTISWSKGGGVISVDVEISRDGGANWETIATNLTATSFVWTVTGPPTCCARVRVHDPTVASRRDASDATFAIEPVALGVEPGVGDAAELAVSPNPFVHGITLRLTAPREVAATLDICGVDGRLIRRLVTGPIAAGGHSWVWDGTDARGRRVAPGVYFARASWPGSSVTRRIARLD